MTSPQVSQIDILGYEMKFIGDRIFNFKHQIHGTKKKYLCDCRRLEDRLHSLHFLSQEAQQEGTDNQVINRICQIDKLQGRVDAINNSVGDHVSILLQKLTNLENSFSNTKSAFKNLKYVPLSWCICKYISTITGIITSMHWLTFLMNTLRLYIYLLFWHLFWIALFFMNWTTFFLIINFFDWFWL